MLFLLWIGSHILFIPTIYKKTRTVLLALMALIFSLIFVIKEPTYDLLVYIDIINNSEFIHEPVSNWFLSLVEVLSFGYTWLYTILITALLLALNVTALIGFSPVESPRYRGFAEIMLSTCVVFLSLYFFLGSQNVLRQCLSVSLFLLFLAYQAKRKYFNSIVFLLLSVFSHFGNAPIIMLLSFYKIFISNLTLKNSLFLGFFLGGVGIFFIKYLFSSNDYLVSDFALSDERTSLWVKWLAISIIVAATTYLTAHHEIHNDKSIQFLLEIRVLLFGILTAIFIFNLNEMFTRVAFNLYAFDMILAFRLLNLSKIVSKNTSYASLILLMSTAFAPNIFQLLNAK